MTSVIKVIGFVFFCMIHIGETVAHAAPPTVSSSPHVILAFQPQRMGDAMQLRGVLEALKKHVTVASVQEVSSERQDLYLKAFSDLAGTVVLLTTNREGIDLVETLRRLRLQTIENLVLVHVSHQRLDGHTRLSGKADIIALPRHALTLGQVIGLFPSRVVLTRGVPHTLNQTQAIDAFQKGGHYIPDHPKYLAVILGGDAELPNGDILFYTPEEAAHLARYAAEKARNEKMHLVVLNGPRTGKYDPAFSGKKDKKKESLDAHKNQHLDSVTQRFLEELKTLKLAADQVTLYHFQFGKTDPYLSVLGGVLSRPGSQMLFPGESTSRISEGCDLLPPASMIVYTHSAMHDAHKKHVTSEWREGRFNVLHMDAGEVSLDKAVIRSTKPTVPASETIARAIIHVLKLPMLMSAQNP